MMGQQEFHVYERREMLTSDIQGCVVLYFSDFFFKKLVKILISFNDQKFGKIKDRKFDKGYTKNCG